MKLGRPPKYDTPQEMQEAIDAYFDGLNGDLPTVTGLAYALGFETREGLLYYEHEKPDFISTVKRAKLRIQVALDSELVRRNGTVTGLIFNLKNNFGWKDAQEFTHATLDDDGERVGIKFV